VELAGDVDGALLAAAVYPWRDEPPSGFDVDVNGAVHKVSVHRRTFG
jgi:hypothetical protein